MGLFTKRSRRANRKAEAKALKHKAGLEAKLGARNERKRDRAELRTQRDVAKQQVATLKAQEKAALKTAAKAERDLFSVGQVRKYLGVARILVPVLAPLAYRAATFVRGELDTRRARQLGIGIDQLTDYSGPGAALQVRIAGAEQTLTELEQKSDQKRAEAGRSRSGKNGRDDDTVKFVAGTRDRLDSLTAAVRTADRMPVPRRRTVHESISHELADIEADLLTRLGVH
ncbi:DUF6474 family protein [Nocardia sp. alder85J]|uniref:DUF6474 family protein n=1 Tax=Nocardia sp. alder85J TaxID=2862949 RepID=UPI001CD44B33|nr:DUF6474 family protein [Nocardia sp. alder85J]MCX4096584.1 DUF6474 family protein [Nocardia sp. alder85J]